MNLINETIKALTESDADTVTEYTITFNDGELYDEYEGEFISEDKSEADDLFNEIKEDGKLNQVSQYYAKTWEIDEDGDYEEGDTEVYYTDGDSLEESNKLKTESIEDEDETDEVVYDSEDPIENMWTAVCVGDNEYIKKAYDSEEIKPGTRIVLFGEPVSFIMGALRNRNWETVELLKSYGETILKAEIDEYKHIMAEKVYEDDITKTAKEESVTTNTKECSTCITESKTLATTPDKGSIMKITSSDFTEEMKQKYPNADYALISDKQAPNGDLYTMLYDNTNRQIGIYTFNYDIPQDLKDLKESILNITDNIIDMINEKGQLTSEELNQYIKQESSTIPNRKYIEGGLRTHIINNLLRTSNIKYDTRQQIFYTK